MQGLKPPASCSEVLRYIFKLSSLEYEVLKQLVRAEARGMTVEELANVLGKHQATVHRALSQLMAKGLCKRKTEYLPKGGYYYRYYVLPPEQLKAMIVMCIEKWYNAAKEQVNKFEI
ncbi:MAG: helix-turn-helix domain-containing protein [Thermoplasmata archaeon]